MNKKVKLLIEIGVFVLAIILIAVVYSFSMNSANKEEVEKESVSVGVVKITDDNFKKEVLESDKPVILEFSSNSCPPCVAMLTTLVDIAKNNKDIKVATLNTDAKECKSIVDEYPIDGTPTIMIFEDGKVKDTLLGAVTGEAIIEALE